MQLQRKVMSARLIVVETLMDDFLCDEISRQEAINTCSVIHFTDKLFVIEKLELVIQQIERAKESANIPGKKPRLSIKLSSLMYAGKEPERRKLSIETDINEIVERVRSVFELIDFFELDASSDLASSILELIPEHKRIITYRDLELGIRPQKTCPESSQIVHQYFEMKSQVAAFLHRVICKDGLAAIEFLHRINRHNVVAYDESEEGLWSRLCASYKGASVVFVEFGNSSVVSLNWLQENYALSRLPEDIVSLYGIAGGNISRSLSPLVHNKGLKALNTPAIYLTFIIKDALTLNDYLHRLSAVGLPIVGLTVTSPLKADLYKEYQSRREIISSTQSANVLMLEDNRFVLETTDDIGINLLLKQKNICVKGKKVAVIGCGCSGRIAAYAINKQGAHVTLFNRGKKRGLLAQDLLDLPFKPLSELDLTQFDIFVNAVPFKLESDLCFPVSKINKSGVYVDFVYNPNPNRLFAAMRRKRIAAVDGFSMLKNQLTIQFLYLTGKSLPDEVAKDLDNELNFKRNSLVSINSTLPERIDQQHSLESMKPTVTLETSRLCE